MLKENEQYFIALTSSIGGYEYIIPLKFHTRDYDEAVNLVKCITCDKPERKLFITDDQGIIDHVIKRKG